MLIQLRFLLLCLLILGLTPVAPAATTADKKAPKKAPTKIAARVKKPRTISDPQLQKVAREGYPLSTQFDRAPIALAPHAAIPVAPVVVPATSLAVNKTDLSAPSRLVNFRLHPIYFVDMLTQHDTLAAARVDVDFIVSDRFTLGPSLIFQHTSSPDTTALAAGGAWQTVELTRWDIGLLSNIYLFGTSREGGLAFRPHAYYVSVSGEKQDSNDATVASGSATAGWRAGAELVYQKVLPIGLNFEVGGGFTYYLSPYSVSYSDANGLKQSAPDHPVEPTVSIGIGWAF